MIRSFTIAALGIVIALSGQVVSAQVQQTQPVQPQQKGQVQPPAQVQPGQPGIVSQQPYNMGIVQNPWFSNPTVRQQLQFNDNQINKMNQAYTESFKRYQQSLNNFDKNLSPEQRDQRMRALQQDFYADLSQSTGNMITDPTQRQRYNQLYWQFRGYNVFDDPTIQQKLNLTDAQRQKLAQYGRDWYAQMGKYNRDFQTDREGTTKRFNEARQQEWQRLISVLTPEQQQMWRQMTGEFYTFPPSVYFQNNINSPAPATTP